MRCAQVVTLKSGQQNEKSSPRHLFQTEIDGDKPGSRQLSIKTRFPIPLTRRRLVCQAWSILGRDDAMKHILCLAAMAVQLVSSARAIPTDYFPPGTLEETAQSSQFREQWYSDQLRSLKEPSLWELSKTQSTQTYRFLWLRSFHQPISVRLDISHDGTGVLTTKAASGQGGDKPGKLVTNKSRALTKEQTTWFLDRIEAQGFWSLPVYEKVRRGVGPNGEATVEVGLDGAQWILEGINEGQYHVADRWSPRNGPLRTLGMIMLFDLAKLNIPHEDVY